MFDVGEVLIDETNEYGTWADWLGVPCHTFSAMFGAVIARGEDYRQTFQHFRPGFDLALERLRREQADVCPALAAGMVGIFLRRGPWGYIHATHPDAAKAHLHIDSLGDLPGLLQAP